MKIQYMFTLGNGYDISIGGDAGSGKMYLELTGEDESGRTMVCTAEIGSQTGDELAASIAHVARTTEASQ